MCIEIVVMQLFRRASKMVGHQWQHVELVVLGWAGINLHQKCVTSQQGNS